jgi:membrane protease YdiL (CAAX protease family)
MAAAQASAYVLSAIIVCYFVSNFLEKRAVRWQDIWLWPSDGTTKTPSVLLIGAGVGVVLGIFAHGYLAVMRLFPSTAELIRTSEQQMASVPNFHLWYAVMAIGAAPFAEEYLFRGLLFRALDREMGRLAPSPVAPCSSLCIIPFSLGFPL